MKEIHRTSLPPLEVRVRHHAEIRVAIPGPYSLANAGGSAPCHPVMSKIFSNSRVGFGSRTTTSSSVVALSSFTLNCATCKCSRQAWPWRIPAAVTASACRSHKSQKSDPLFRLANRAARSAVELCQNNQASYLVVADATKRSAGVL